MMNMTWLRGDWTFGDPLKCFTICTRTRVGLELRAFLESFSDQLKENPEPLARFLEEVISREYPFRADRCLVTVLAMQFHLASNTWHVTALHPSFPRLPRGALAPVESLERCPVCRGPLTRQDEQGQRSATFARIVDSKPSWCETVCSKECSEVPEREQSGPQFDLMALPLPIVSSQFELTALNLPALNSPWFKQLGQEMTHKEPQHLSAAVMADETSLDENGKVNCTVESVGQSGPKEVSEHNTPPKHLYDEVTGCASAIAHIAHAFCGATTHGPQGLVSCALPKGHLSNHISQDTMTVRKHRWPREDEVKQCESRCPGGQHHWRCNHLAGHHGPHACKDVSRIIEWENSRETTPLGEQTTVEAMEAAGTEEQCESTHTDAYHFYRCRQPAGHQGPHSDSYANYGGPPTVHEWYEPSLSGSARNDQADATAPAMEALPGKSRSVEIKEKCEAIRKELQERSRGSEVLG